MCGQIYLKAVDLWNQIQYSIGAGSILLHLMWSLQWIPIKKHITIYMFWKRSDLRIMLSWCFQKLSLSLIKSWLEHHWYRPFHPDLSYKFPNNIIEIVGTKFNIINNWYITLRHTVHKWYSRYCIFKWISTLTVGLFNYVQSK